MKYKYMRPMEMSHDKRGLGEEALSKAAEIGFSSQLDEVEELDVEIEADPLEVLQGKVDSVSMRGKKMVQGDLRVEEMDMQTGSISINVMSAAFGKIELTKPTDAAARFVLTEQDISQSLNSELIHNQLQNLKVQVAGQPMTVDAQRGEFSLPGDGRIGVRSEILLQETGETQQVSFTAVPRLERSSRTIALEDVQYSEGKDLSPELTKTLVDKISNLLELHDFELEGMSLRLKELEVQKGSMTLQTESHVEHLPSS